MLEFKNYYPWFAKDWLTSDTRARLTVPQRGIFRDLLDFCHMESGISSDLKVLAAKLALPAEYLDDLSVVLKEFEVHPEVKNKLMHRRVWLVIDEQRQYADKGKAGAAKRWSKPKPLEPSAQTSDANNNDELCPGCLRPGGTKESSTGRMWHVECL
jgi:hypothetical protein